MVGAPDWAPAAASLRGLDPAGVDIGLHLDLTEWPLDTSLRQPLGRLIVAAGCHRLDPVALRREIARQLDAFEAAMGRPPSHVDGHQHVHQLPALRQALLAVLADRPGPVRPWLRSTRPAPGAWRGGGVKPWIIAALGGRGLARAAQAQGWQTNRRLAGVYGFTGGPAAYQALLVHWLACAGRGDLLMCHPATGTPVNDPIGPARQAEWQVLSGEGFAHGLDQAGVGLRPMSRLLAPC